MQPFPSVLPGAQPLKDKLQAKLPPGPPGSPSQSLPLYQARMVVSLARVPIQPGTDHTEEEPPQL